MKNESFFWKVLDLLDWNHEGDDEAVLSPALEYLSQQSDEDIFAFDDTMAALLYALDSRKITEGLYGDTDGMSADLFLYQRCVAIVNGRNYYEAIRDGRAQLNPDLEFESVLYLPRNAWAKKHRQDAGEYPHTPEPSYESMSNHALWA